MGRALIKRLFALALVLWPTGLMAQMSVPVYGNWCGPDYPINPALASPPIDSLDSACMRHDYCTAAKGRFDCGCDLALMYDLRNTRWENPFIQSDARGVYDAIAIVPCTDAYGTAEKQSLFLQDALIDAFNGRAVPEDMMERWRRLLLRSLN